MHSKFAGNRFSSLPAVLVAFGLGSAACHHGDTQAGAGADGGVFASGAAPDTDASADPDASVAEPPAPVVAEDPNVPLNEAVVGAASVAPDYSADQAPPAPPTEDQPPQPGAGDVWVPGYWWWSPPLGRYVWVSGAWREPPPEQLWYPGSWGLVGGRYYWTPGYWGPRGYTREMIGVPPPPFRSEVYGAPPGVGFYWTPGYYAFRGGAYEWVGGSWLRPPSPGLGWVPARYVSVGGRYYLQPGRWDLPPARRGVVYRPVINVAAGGRVNLSPVPTNVVTAHANFVAAAAKIQAQGGTRLPNGGYAAHPPAQQPQPGMGGLPPSGGGQPPRGGPPQGGAPQAGPPQGAPPQGAPPHGAPPHGAPPQGGAPQSGPPQGGPPQSVNHHGQGPGPGPAPQGAPPPQGRPPITTHPVFVPPHKQH